MSPIRGPKGWTRTMDWWPQHLGAIPPSRFKQADLIAEALIAGCEEWGINEDSMTFGRPLIRVTVRRERAFEAEAALPAAALDVEALGLSPEQTRILRDHLAKRQQTVSEFLGYVLMDYGLGRATGKDYPPPDQVIAKEPG